MGLQDTIDLGLTALLPPRAHAGLGPYVVGTTLMGVGVGAIVVGGIADIIPMVYARLPRGLRVYWGHAMLNLGQATRDVRYAFDHPAADKVAPRGTAMHAVSSLTARIPSFASNLYFAALPPQLHHSKEELAEELRPAKQMFLHGYAPWDYPLDDVRPPGSYPPQP